MREIAVAILPPTTRALGDAELFTEHGMDSMMATQFSCVLADSFGLVLSPAIALEFQTVEGLSERILELAAAKIQA